MKSELRPVLRFLVILLALKGVQTALKIVLRSLKRMIFGKSSCSGRKDAQNFLDSKANLKGQHHLGQAVLAQTILAQAGCEPDPATGALTPPIHFASTFERNPDLSYPRGFSYSRERNPTRCRLEDALAAAENGDQAAAFASGSAAAAAVLQTMPEGHVILPDDVYYGNRQMVTSVFKPWGLGLTTIDASDLEQVSKAVKEAAEIVKAKNSRALLWLETPSNPNLKITDIRKACEIAHEYNVAVLVDATWFSPAVCRPLELGCDLVLHSTTKYLGGHSDLIGGAIIGGSTSLAREVFSDVRDVQHYCGAVPAPFDCWLTLRGMRTLAVRMAVHSRNALALAQFLHSHPKVAVVNYAGLESHPGHEIAKSQVGDLFGGMLSFLIDGSEQDAIKVVASTKLAKRGTSLGGTETLIEHRASIEGPDSKTNKTLIRVSTGLEASVDIIEDFAQALSAI